MPREAELMVTMTFNATKDRNGVLSVSNMGCGPEDDGSGAKLCDQEQID